MDVLNYDCWSYILNYLSYVDIRSLRITCSDMYTLPQPSFKRIFKNRLLPLLQTEEKAEEFCQKLYEAGAYVSGSFILDCLYDTNFHSDIDVYDNADQTKPYRDRSDFILGEYQYSSRSDFQGYTDPYLKFCQYLYQAGFINAGDALNQSVSYIIRYYVPKRIIPNTNALVEFRKDSYPDKIQLIPIALPRANGRSQIGRFMLASFDLDICKCAFDGQDLYVRSWRKMITRKDYIKPNTRVLTSVYLDTQGDNAVTEKRMQKYRQRGFHIEKHPDYDKIEREIHNVLSSCVHMCYGEFDDRYHDKIKYIGDGSINLDKYFLVPA